MGTVNQTKVYILQRYQIESNRENMCGLKAFNWNTSYMAMQRSFERQLTTAEVTKYKCEEEVTLRSCVAHFTVTSSRLANKVLNKSLIAFLNKPIFTKYPSCSICSTK
jgi:hypothetical protein